MNSAPKPADEAARLASLREYDVLDTLPEQAYDDITRIASQICDCPIALVSLVDEDRQWFKSRRGIDAQQTPRDVAFCAHAILDPDHTFVVPDATRDARFADNPLVTDEPRVRFYAGAPLVTADGHALGTLCVIDRKAHDITPEQLEALQALSRQVIAQLELRRTVKQLQMSSSDLEARNVKIQQSRDQLAELCEALETQAEVIERDLHRAEIIQRSLLPPAPPRLPGYRIEAFYRPGRNVGGDLYDVLQIGSRYLALVIADAAGHGVSAAMLSVLFKHREVLVDEDGRPLAPAEALARMSDALHADVTAPGAFVTAALCLLELDTSRMLVASAGQTALLVLRADGRIETIPHTGPALGLNTGSEFAQRELWIGGGDRLLMYTDGLFDVLGKPPSTEEVAAVLAAHTGDAVLEGVFDDLVAGHEREERDDITLLLLEARHGESRFVQRTASVPASIAPVEEADAEISHGETDNATTLCLSGRVTWLFAEALLQAATDVLEAQRDLVIDLGECDYLDSTLLGTLHEIVERAANSRGRVVLQRVPDALRTMFEELSLAQVLGCCASDALPLPRARQPLQLRITDVHRQKLRLLKAHEVLAGLSDDNREQFGGVVEAMREDLQ